MKTRAKTQKQALPTTPTPTPPTTTMATAAGRKKKSQKRAMEVPQDQEQERPIQPVQPVQPVLRKGKADVSMKEDVSKSTKRQKYAQRPELQLSQQLIQEVTQLALPLSHVSIHKVRSGWEKELKKMRARADGQVEKRRQEEKQSQPQQPASVVQTAWIRLLTANVMQEDALYTTFQLTIILDNHLTKSIKMNQPIITTFPISLFAQLVNRWCHQWQHRPDSTNSQWNVYSHLFLVRISRIAVNLLLSNIESNHTGTPNTNANNNNNLSKDPLLAKCLSLYSGIRLQLRRVILEGIPNHALGEVMFLNHLLKTLRMQSSGSAVSPLFLDKLFNSFLNHILPPFFKSFSAIQSNLYAHELLRLCALFRYLDLLPRKYGQIKTIFTSYVTALYSRSLPLSLRKFSVQFDATTIENFLTTNQITESILIEEIATRVGAEDKNELLQPTLRSKRSTHSVITKLQEHLASGVDYEASEDDSEAEEENDGNKGNDDDDEDQELNTHVSKLVRDVQMLEDSDSDYDPEIKQSRKLKDLLMSGEQGEDQESVAATIKFLTKRFKN